MFIVDEICVCCDSEGYKFLFYVIVVKWILCVFILEEIVWWWFFGGKYFYCLKLCLGYICVVYVFEVV